MTEKPLSELIQRIDELEKQAHKNDWQVHYDEYGVPLGIKGLGVWPWRDHECELIAALRNAWPRISAELKQFICAEEIGLEAARKIAARYKKEAELMKDSLYWIMPKVHQGNHDGEFHQCGKATCVEYRNCIAKINKLRGEA